MYLCMYIHTDIQKYWYTHKYTYKCIHKYTHIGSASGVMVIVTGIGHGDTSSNPGLIAFHITLIPLGKV